MGITYQSIRSQRQWRAATGLTQSDFERLVPLFAETYEDFYGQSLAASVAAQDTQPSFATIEELLFFILYSLKSGLTYDLIALSFDISRSVAFEKQAIGVRLLSMALQATGDLPAGRFKSINDLEKALDQHDELLIDGTEQRRQRPENQEVQKEDYSGKKKRTPSKRP